jgi:hypothetical protein
LTPVPRPPISRLAPTDALLMLPCVALAALAVGVFALHCLDTHQPGRALFVFLWFLRGAAVLYGLADITSKDGVAVNVQAGRWYPGCARSRQSRAAAPVLRRRRSRQPRAFSRCERASSDDWRPTSGQASGAKSHSPAALRAG